MGWDDWLDIGAVANPVALIGSGVAGIVGGGLDYLGAERDRDAARRANAENIAAQREFAQMGIRWRVEDARAAGLHPLAALGASGPGFSPSFQMASDGDKYRAVGGALREMGQNLGRAAQVGMTDEERALKRTTDMLTLQRMQLENELLRSQKTAIDRQALPPPAQRVVTKPVEVMASNPGYEWQLAGSYPGVGYMNTPSGKIPIMPPDLAEALESDETTQRQWGIAFKGTPNLAPKYGKPRAEDLPPEKRGGDFVWNFPRQMWVPMSRAELEARGRSAAEKKHVGWGRDMRVSYRARYPERRNPYRGY